MLRQYVQGLEDLSKLHSLLLPTPLITTVLFLKSLTFSCLIVLTNVLISAWLLR